MFKFHYPNKQELMGALAQTKKDYKLTNKQIATAVGSNEVSVSRWLTGKAVVGAQFVEALENFIAQTWQPGIVCIWNDTWIRKGQFLLVGSIYDPFYTWIHNTDTQTIEEDNKFIEDMERQVQTGEAKLYIVKKYVDMDEANKIGRDEEQLYNLGAATGSEEVTFLRPGGKIEKRKTLIYEPRN